MGGFLVDNLGLMSHLYYGDNLDILRRYIRDQSVDLIYLDPPFNSNATYNILFQDKSGNQSTAQIRAFDDTWEWSVEESERIFFELVNHGDELGILVKALRDSLGTNDMMAYLVMMSARMKELYRVLKPSGSIYLHCDPTASHYLKLVMDAVFGPQNFQNEIIWKRTNARSTTGRWPRIHDVILFYSRSDAFVFTSLKTKADKTKLPHTLITGPDGFKYQTFELTAPGTTKKGDSGTPWRGFDPNKYGRHWANNEAQREEWDAAGLIHWPKEGIAGGFPRRRDEEPFMPEARTITVGDVWTDIDRLNQTAKERLTYPTQKPEALLERIIRASSNEGDVVLDPFCGCGTTVAVAERLKRQWVGIDITRLAITLVKFRLANAFGPSILNTYEVKGEPTTVEEAEGLAAEEPLHFQEWALGLIQARPSKVKKGADKGIDGRLFFQEGDKVEGVVISVKGGKTSVKDVRDLRGVMEREKSAIGVLISLQKPTAPMRTEAAAASFFQSKWGTYARIQLLTIKGLLKKTQRLECPPTHVTFKRAPKAKYEQPKTGYMLDDA